MNTTIEVKGQLYSIGRMNALSQFHVSRRLAPVLAAMGISISQLELGAKMDLEDFLPVLGPVTDIMAKMSDSDANYIIMTSLGVVGRQQGPGKFAAVTAGQNMLFEDIDLPIMLRLVVEVLRVNLAGFFPGLGDDQTSPSS